MFGSKNKKTNKQVKVNIETMEGNLKGSSGEAKVVDYKKIDSSNDIPPDNNVPNVDKEQSSNQPDNKPFKSPFKDENLPIGQDDGAGKIGQGTFPPGSDGVTTDSSRTPAENANNNFSLTEDNKEESDKGSPKKDNLPFLHQTIDEKTDIKTEQSKKTVADKPLDIGKKEKSGMNPFLLVILFVILLAGILLGGYYFYMSKNTPKNEEVEPDNNKNTQIDESTTVPVETTVTDESTSKPVPTQPDENTNKPVIEKFVTTETTFIEDLTGFIVDLKEKRDLIDLQNGIFIDPMINSTEILNSGSLLRALHMVDFFIEGDLKNPCKLFAIEEAGNIRIAVIFEFAETADDKLIKSSLIERENGLLTKMQYLFVDGIKPTVPTDANFAVSDDNMQARYVNYSPGVATTSVDWNILDLGKGKLIYFATSRNLAKELTEYFMRLNIK